MSVMHLLVRRHPSNTEPIKSKEELVFHCGFRRFRASPIFSQHTSGSSQNKHVKQSNVTPKHAQEVLRSDGDETNYMESESRLFISRYHPCSYGKTEQQHLLWGPVLSSFDKLTNRASLFNLLGPEQN